mmetsp:Transcript_7981/g.11856  ORF Transcript_7981/g.11856 Transcript_7981/m.11856 type:complete len:344 (-) Transcript_7981:54-1085(-)
MHRIRPSSSIQRFATKSSQNNLIRTFRRTPFFLTSSSSLRNNSSLVKNKRKIARQLKAAQSFIHQESFSTEITEALASKIDPSLIEIRPEGFLFLPSTSYRTFLNTIFGPGAWVVVPIGDCVEAYDHVSQQYALFIHGKMVSSAWGDQSIRDNNRMGLGTALESAKSHALVRCCKDIGIASELWNSEFVEQWKEDYAVEVWCEHAVNKRKKKLWRRQSAAPFSYPYRETNASGQDTSSSAAPSTSSVNSAFDSPSFSSDEPELFANFDDGESSSSFSSNSSSSSTSPEELLNETISFGKFMGKTLAEVKDDARFHAYISWAETSMREGENRNKLMQYKQALNL